MTWKSELEGTIFEEVIRELPNRFDVIGDIAVVAFPPQMEAWKGEIARAIISRHKNIRTVLNKVSKVQGKRRIAAVEVVAGGGTITLHRESGFVYRLDVAKVFFNPRLSYERQRVASQTRPGERVLVPFCGVGPFAIPLAARGAEVVALETSPDACRWLAKNARQNGVEDNLTCIRGDGLRAAWTFRLEFDRAVLPIPYGMDHALEALSPAVREGGAVHFYTFKKAHQIDELKEMYRDMGFQIKLCRRCGNVAPGVSRWAFDMVKGGT